ncbi:plasmid replication protein RepC [Pseudooceanicola sp. LIPI14-2-Ac024]|uniref:plasmid replication protein RepC n=1 Tax=Pseudooceanicola sp. LIPI14-2-Ac024 TaxID=3344875 RepID=UPI0035D02F49
MQTVTTTPFGRRPVTAGQIESAALAARPAPVPQVDKWEVMKDLSTARAGFGISDRTLAVLNVLVGVHSERMLADGDMLIVYASNATLSARAHGMPESTLRRHLAALVEAGLIARHDSPNGKRYVRRDGDGDAMRAFGFDLRPLLVRACEIALAARAERQRLSVIAARREEVVLLMRDAGKLADYAAGQGTNTDALADRLLLAKRELRRKLDLDTLETLRDALVSLVDKLRETVAVEVEAPVAPTELSACDSQNERHIQEPDKKQSDLKGQGPDLRTVLNRCPDILPYADDGVRTWDDFTRLMARIAPMTGIDLPTWTDACRAMGPIEAAIAVAGIVQRIGMIRSPGAYLRTLAKKARGGAFSVDQMLGQTTRQAA